ncbi:MAG: dihydroorotase [Bacteroidales bacterium]
MKSTLITNARIINENRNFTGHVLIRGHRIEKIWAEPAQPTITHNTEIINARGKWLLPGVIDDQVHFREPGLTHKGDLHTESRAAVAGGVTSYMDMPNTIPPTTTQALLNEKIDLAASKSIANFGFFIGATNNNLDELKRADARTTCGIKVFMGSSTGNLLVDDPQALDAIFRLRKMPIAVHAEDDSIILKNLEHYRSRYGDDIPMEMHPLIRSAEACYQASSLAVSLARQHKSRLHLIHLSTAREITLLEKGARPSQKLITSEVCVHHLWFDDQDYEAKGSLIKWNPAIKRAEDREALVQALLNDQLDIIATDHAPHTLAEKDRPYTSAPSGAPMIQHSLPLMLQFHHQGIIPVERIVEKMCHNPAEIFRIKNRGYIREGYYADLVIVDPSDPWTVNPRNIYYKCGWSPLQDTLLQSRVCQTFVNGHLAYDQGLFNESERGMVLEFER